MYMSCVIVTCTFDSTRVRVFLDTLCIHQTLTPYFPINMQPIVYDAALLHTRDVLYTKYLVAISLQPTYERYVRTLTSSHGIPIRRHVHDILDETPESMINTVLVAMMPNVFLDRSY